MWRGGDGDGEGVCANALSLEKLEILHENLYITFINTKASSAKQQWIDKCVAPAQRGASASARVLSPQLQTRGAFAARLG